MNSFFIHKSCYLANLESNVLIVLLLHVESRKATQDTGVGEKKKKDNSNLCKAYNCIRYHPKESKFFSIVS